MTDTNFADWAKRLRSSEEDLKLYLETFSMIDENKDGLITPQELLNALNALGCRTTLEHANRMVQLADENEDGMVDVDEYLSIILKSMLTSRPNIDEECAMAFKVFDKNQDGYISFDELRCAMTEFGQSLSDKEAMAMLRMMDMNKDGRISYAEFVAGWTEMMLIVEKYD